jgi:hypothetical protein
LVNLGGLEGEEREAVSGPIIGSDGGDWGGGGDSARQVIKPGAAAFEALLDRTGRGERGDVAYLERVDRREWVVLSRVGACERPQEP